MYTSRLGKLIVVLLGSIGLLYIGGGHARADAVNVSSQSTNNISSSTNNISQSQSSVSVSTTGGSSNNDHNSTTSSNNTSTTTSTDHSASVINQNDQSPLDKTNSEVDSNSSTNAITASADSAKAVTDTTTVASGASTAPIAALASSLAKSSNSYSSHHVVATVASSDQTTPVAPATAGSGQKPALPTMPQGTTMLVSTVIAPTPMLKFHGSLGGLGAARGIGLNIFLTLLVIAASIILIGAFLDHLRAMGFSLAPRGATTQFNFAFAVSEFGLSQRLKIDSLFSVLKLSQDGGCYGGRP